LSQLRYLDEVAIGNVKVFTSLIIFIIIITIIIIVIVIIIIIITIIAIVIKSDVWLFHFVLYIVTK